MPLRGKSCSNGRLLTMPTLLGSPSSACCEKVAAYLVALRRLQIGRHQIRLSIPCKVVVPQNEGSRLLLEFTVHGLVDGWCSTFLLVEVLVSLGIVSGERGIEVAQVAALSMKFIDWSLRRCYKERDILQTI